LELLEAADTLTAVRVEKTVADQTLTGLAQDRINVAAA